MLRSDSHVPEGMLGSDSHVPEYIYGSSATGFANDALGCLVSLKIHVTWSLRMRLNKNIELLKYIIGLNEVMLD